MVALLDACVLYPAPIRDLFLTMAEAELFKPKWTNMIQDEWTRNLLANRSDLDGKRIQRTVQAMNEAFPDSLLENYEHLIPDLQLPDIDDRHVLAAAISGGANFLVTFNLKDFPSESFLKSDLTLIHPDDFAVKLILDSPNAAFDSFILMVERLRNPPMSFEQVIQSLDKCGMPLTATTLVSMRGTFESIF